MAAPIPPGYPPAPAEREIVSQLEGMGFSRDLAEQAIAGTEDGSLLAALDWLVHLCQTPRSSTEEAEPSPRSTEEEELSRAIQMSLTVQSPALVPPAIARQPTEEEEVEAAIAASLSDLQQDTALAIQQVASCQMGEHPNFKPRPDLTHTLTFTPKQVESYRMGAAQRHSMLPRPPSPRAPSPPPIRHDAAREQAMQQALHSRAPQAMQIAKVMRSP